MAREIKRRKVVLHKVINGVSVPERMEIAYEEWLLGKAESDKALADKHHLFPQEFSKYLSYRLDLNRKNNFSNDK